MVVSAQLAETVSLVQHLHDGIFNRPAGQAWLYGWERIAFRDSIRLIKSSRIREDRLSVRAVELRWTPGNAPLSHEIFH